MRTTKKTLIALCAADNDKQGASPEASAQQRPTKAPEPPTKNQPEASNAASAKSSEQEKCDNATTTVAFDVGLRSFVLSICTDSVCVGLRMMERFQQYQQHAHLWQGRPQASAYSAATLVYQIDSGQALAVSVDL